ncbi:hypothetical protein V1514DRAFT_342503 [Lipomyces japonicus]|uniref:uncharacterized protein n=1 Tax=Lipomyces japonicus TaxID=56871 RepID=UPI0034CDBA70
MGRNSRIGMSQKYSGRVYALVEKYNAELGKQEVQNSLNEFDVQNEASLTKIDANEIIKVLNDGATCIDDRKFAILCELATSKRYVEENWMSDVDLRNATDVRLDHFAICRELEILGAETKRFVGWAMDVVEAHIEGLATSSLYREIVARYLFVDCQMLYGMKDSACTKVLAQFYDKEMKQQLPSHDAPASLAAYVVSPLPRPPQESENLYASMNQNVDRLR